MKTLIRIAAPVMALALMGGVPSFAQAAQNTVEAAPASGSPQAHQGYLDGVQAAALDRAAKRPIDAKVSHLYVHPPVKGAARDEYRASFEAGYQSAVKTDSGS
jgi:hypothetical protein